MDPDLDPEPRPDADLRASVQGPRDLIAAVWYRMGYRPQESVALVALTDKPPAPDGSRRPGFQVGAVVRVDLPPPGSPGADERALWVLLITTLLRPLLEHARPRRIWAMVASAEVTDPADRSAGNRLVDLAGLLEDMVLDCGVEVADVVGVGEERYGSLTCDDEICCPPGGRPVAEVLSGPVAAAMVLDGRILEAGRDDLGRLVDGPADEPPSDRVTIRPPGEWLARWQEHVGSGGREPDPWDPADARGFGLVLAGREVREALLCALTPLPPDLARAAPAGPPARARARAARVLAGPPIPERARRAETLLAQVARCRPGPSGADAVALLAWIVWWSGDSTRACVLTDRALARDPGHGLAAFLADGLAQGMPPPWVATGTG